MPKGKYIAKGTLGKNQYSEVAPRKPIFPVGPSIAYIELTRGQWTLIDVEDAERVSRIFWMALLHHTGVFYARNSKQGALHNFLVHPGNGLIVDHVNGNSLDNRKANLRVCSVDENGRNRRVSRNNKSGYKGVTLYRPTGQWRADIRIAGKLIYLGKFNTKEEAAAAYSHASIKLFGEFTRSIEEARCLLPPDWEPDAPIRNLPGHSQRIANRRAAGTQSYQQISQSYLFPY